VSDPGASIEVVVERSPLTFFLARSIPSFTIDGGSVRRGRWGTNVVSVLPGYHDVEIWVGESRRIGRNRKQVSVQPGCVTEVRWKAPILPFAGGRINTRVRLAMVDVRQPAGWYDDPTGKWDQRWWDGTDWTNHVQRDGVVVHDN
jgi:hypothetical protein